MSAEHEIVQGKSPWKYCRCGWGHTLELSDDSLYIHLMENGIKEAPRNLHFSETFRAFLNSISGGRESR